MSLFEELPIDVIVHHILPYMQYKNIIYLFEVLENSNLDFYLNLSHVFVHWQNLCKEVLYSYFSLDNIKKHWYNFTYIYFHILNFNEIYEFNLLKIKETKNFINQLYRNPVWLKYMRPFKEKNDLTELFFKLNPVNAMRSWGKDPTSEEINCKNLVFCAEYLRVHKNNYDCFKRFMHDEYFTLQALKLIDDMRVDLAVMKQYSIFNKKIFLEIFFKHDYSNNYYLDFFLCFEQPEKTLGLKHLRDFYKEFFSKEENLLIVISKIKKLKTKKHRNAYTRQLFSYKPYLKDYSKVINSLDKSYCLQVFYYSVEEHLGTDEIIEIMYKMKKNKSFIKNNIFHNPKLAFMVIDNKNIVKIIKLLILCNNNQLTEIITNKLKDRKIKDINIIRKIFKFYVRNSISSKHNILLCNVFSFENYYKNICDLEDLDVIVKRHYTQCDTLYSLIHLHAFSLDEFLTIILKNKVKLPETAAALFEAFPEQQGSIFQFYEQNF